MTPPRSAPTAGAAPAAESDVDQSDLRAFLGYNIKRAYLSVRADFIASLAHLDLNPSQFSALNLVVANPGVSQSALARALSVERSGIVALINSLEERGLVTRDPVPGDRRSHALRATLAGRRHAARAGKALRRHEERVNSLFSPEERELLVELLNRVEDQLPAIRHPSSRGREC